LTVTRAEICDLRPQRPVPSSSYLFAAIGNCWATRGRHPGWMLYAVALVLIVYGVR